MRANSRKDNMKTNNISKIRVPHRRGWLSALGGFIMLAVVVPDGWSQIVYRTGFEPPTVTPGLPLVGQDGWIVGQTPDGPLRANAANISTGLPRQGRAAVP